VIAWLRQTAEDIVYGPAVVCIAVDVVVFQIVVMVIAVWRRRRGALMPLTVHAVAGAAIAVLPVVFGLSVHAARALMVDAMTTTSLDESQKAAAMWRSISGQSSAIPFAVNVIGAALGIWFVGATYTMSAPGANGRSRSFPPVALVGIGLLPIAFGAAQWCAGLIRTLALVADMSPEHKPVVISDALDGLRAQLTNYARGSMAAILILAVIAVALIWANRNRDAAPAPAHPRPPRLPLVLSAAALLLAALLVFAARPMAAENTLPWPPKTGPSFVFPRAPPTPDLVGPDEVVPLHVISMHRDGLGLDGTTAETFDSLESKLITLRNRYKLLGWRSDVREEVLILADPATSIERLTSTLIAVGGAGYDGPVFVFAKTATLVRPVLGKLQRTTATGARIKLAFTDDKYEDHDPYGEWKDAVPLRLQDFADYGGFARRLVELRRAGKPVIVKVDPTAP
jgi:hypothetical protein